MPSKTLIGRQSELISELGGAARYADAALILTRDRDGSTLLYAGGEWDRLEQRFTGRECDAAIVPLEESQVDFVEWFRGYLQAYREGFPREVSLALAAGARRGGKTFAAFVCQIAALMDVPLTPSGRPTLGWAVSRTYKQRDELDEIVATCLPAGAYHHQRAPEHRYRFASGAVLKNLSADNPEILKQGRVDFLFYNEGQLMTPAAVRNGMYGTADSGGLTIMAANPPAGSDGDWLRDLKDAIDEDGEIRKVAKFFVFDPTKNTKIDQPARRRVAALAKKMDPEGSEADADGTWRRWGDLAYPRFNNRPLDKDGHVGDPPEAGLVDATQAVTKSIFGRPFDHVAGGDFQRRPQAAAVLRVVQVPDVGDVYWFVDEVMTKGTEVELSTELLAHEYGQKSGDARSLMIVGDCSGSWQGAERIKGRTSFGLLENEGWHVQPAEIVRSAQKDRPRNPPVAQRLGLVERLMTAGRVRVSPNCKWLREAFAKCVLRRTETGLRVPKGAHSHVTDAASYAIWRLEKFRPVGSGPPKPGSWAVIDVPRRGPRLF